jgi:hypothetical protein
MPLEEEELNDSKLGIRSSRGDCGRVRQHADLELAGSVETR